MVATAVSPAVRRAMREYESENLKYWNEPISGKYQQEDYNRINAMRKNE